MPRRFQAARGDGQARSIQATGLAYATLASARKLGVSLSEEAEGRVDEIRGSVVKVGPAPNCSTVSNLAAVVAYIAVAGVVGLHAASSADIKLNHEAACVSGCHVLLASSLLLPQTWQRPNSKLVTNHVACCLKASVSAP